MNAFGEALNLVFMRWSGDFSSGSMPMDSISDCIPMSSSSYSQANGLNLRLHSHEFLFPANESLDAWVQVPIPKPMDSISDCIPMSPYSPANESLDAWVQVLFPCQWISGCSPMSSYLPANESLDAFPWVPISLPNFWSLLVGYHPCPAILIQNVPIEAQKIAFWRDFGGTPIHTTWVPLKSIVERFRALLRDFCF